MTKDVADVDSAPDPAAAFLSGLRLADSFLPVGSYTASYGVEQFVQTDRIETAEDLRIVLEDYLREVVGPCEVVALANAYDAAAAGDCDRLVAVDRRLHSMTLPEEFRTSSERAGEQLLDLFAEEASPDDGPAGAYLEAVESGRAPGNYAVALAVVAHRRGLSRDRACLVYAYSFTTGLLGAAQRLGRLGHTAIQNVLADLRPLIVDVCETYADRDLAAMRSFAPTVEVMGMCHEDADRRLFMS